MSTTEWLSCTHMPVSAEALGRSQEAADRYKALRFYCGPLCTSAVDQAIFLETNHALLVSPAAVEKQDKL